MRSIRHLLDSCLQFTPTVLLLICYLIIRYAYLIFFFYSLLLLILLLYTGIDAPRVSVINGNPLPSPRLVTRTVHQDFDHPDTDVSILLFSWGQLLDHDLTLAAPPRGKYK